MTQNEKLVNDLDEYEKTVISEGLSAILKKKITPAKLCETLTELSDIYGGYGLISVMDYARNSL